MGLDEGDVLKLASTKTQSPSTFESVSQITCSSVRNP